MSVWSDGSATSTSVLLTFFVIPRSISFASCAFVPQEKSWRFEKA